MWVPKQLTSWSLLTSILRKSATIWLHSSKYFLLFSAEERNSYRVGITWGWVNNFWVNYPFKEVLKKMKQQTKPPLEKTYICSMQLDSWLKTLLRQSLVTTSLSHIQTTLHTTSKYSAKSMASLSVPLPDVWHPLLWHPCKRHCVPLSIAWKQLNMLTASLVVH